MAYMNQEKKALLAVEIAKVMPPNWKYTLKVRHHSTLVLTIRQADVDLIAENVVKGARLDGAELSYVSLNEYNLQGHYSGKLLKIFEGIRGAMMIGNHDRSDIQSDYFDVGWYIDINIGEYKSPFRYVPAAKKSGGVLQAAYLEKHPEAQERLKQSFRKRSSQTSPELMKAFAVLLGETK